MLKSDLYLLAKQHTCSSSNILLSSTAVVLLVSLLTVNVRLWMCKTIDHKHLRRIFKQNKGLYITKE